jgi:hypothetical protein
MYTIAEEVESFVASGDLSGMKNRIVDIVGQFKIGHALAGGGFGVLLDAPKAGEHAAVVTDGITMVFVGAALSAGADVTSAASGWAVSVVSGAGSRVLGRLTTSAASGMLASVKLDRSYRPNSVGN